MSRNLPRREFFKAASALGAGLGLGLHNLPRGWARAEDVAVGPDAVRFRPEIEPVVRWIEQTPRERILEVAAEEIGKGLSYRDLMAGLFLAGIRNIKPRPVGFKFHAVLSIHSAHLIAQTASLEDRLLPLFWGLDNFKSAQAQDVKEGDWTLSKVDESHVPGPTEARAAFQRAMDQWDADAADTATAALCREAGAIETIEAFWRFAVRDQRNIGHKAIFAMQCWRTLSTIGWQHAEPVLRSLSYGMLDLQGDSNRAAVGPYEANLENAKRFREGWTIGKADPAATKAHLQTLRDASPEEASADALRLVNEGVSPGALWDAILLAGSEMFLSNPSIAPLHAVTSANALHYIYLNSGDDETRRLALLQGSGWMPLFRGRGQGSDPLQLDAIEPVKPSGSGTEAVESIFGAIAEDRRKAAAEAIGYLEAGAPEDLFALARSMIIRKSNDSHQYKYGAAAWEEVQLASAPEWQPALTAAIMAYVPSNKAADSPLMERASEAIGRIGRPA